MTRPSTIPKTDHALLDDPAVELGVRFLDETPRSRRGPAVPELRARGLDNRQAVEAIRRHGLKLTRST
jgi:hypothetical protein